LLGQADGFGWAGELQRLWTNALPSGYSCGCGLLVRECPVWQAVLAEAVGGVDGLDPAAAIEFDRRYARGRHQLPFLDRAVRRAVRRDPLARRHLDALTRLYRALAQELDAQVLIDSSHAVAYARLLHEVPDVSLRIVHVVRDPRAVAYSWSKWRPSGPSGADAERWFPRYSSVASSVFWDIAGLSTERMARELDLPLLQVRYEDFVAEPRRATEEVAAFAGLADAELPFVDDRTAVLGVNHSAWGNPSRFSTGRIRIEHDEEWRRSMRARDRQAATLLTLPLLGRYGYGVRD
jgi:hypothetical protein